MSNYALTQKVEKAAVGLQRPLRAVAYLRVSTTEQVNTDYNPEGISIPAQREAVQRKADALGSGIVREFIEPGKTGTSIEKRPRFQEMIAWVKRQGDIDYIIVYHFNRVFRNSVDAGITKRDLKKVGTRIVSTILDMGEGPESAMVETIIHAVDQYQSQASGADISYKMSQKLKNGGTLSMAKLGYLNVREPKPEGGEIRTVAVDPDRAPLVQQGFELFATGDYTAQDISDELYDRGLRTRATPRRPAKKVSKSKIAAMLQDPYYLGYVTYEGQLVLGRHEALVDQALFDRVQEVLDTRRTAKERRRVHHHCLKGSMFCGRCKKAGVIQRMIYQHAVNSRGSEYEYFFCRNKQDGTCGAPYANALRLEAAVEEHYASVRFDDDFIAAMHIHVTSALQEEESASHTLNQQLTEQLRALEAKEDNLLDLVADAAVSSARARDKLSDIQLQRQRITERLSQTNEDLALSARLITLALNLLKQPRKLYRRCNEQQRRLLNQAVFHQLYLYDEEVTDQTFRSPFAELNQLQTARRARFADGMSTNESRAPFQSEGGPALHGSLEVLLAGFEPAFCSSRASLVDVTGFEPVTFSVSGKRSPAELNVRELRGGDGI